MKKYICAECFWGAGIALGVMSLWAVTVFVICNN